uniref:RagB/SusD domain-containing protein n=1 Tax=Sphingobacterium sp. (strain 21) TaxID=743722 RepID=F4C136_SPHS2
MMKQHVFIILLSFSITGCSKLIDIDTPKNQLSADGAYADSAAVTALLANTYALLEKTVEPNLTRNLGLYADDLSFTQTTTQQTEFWNSTVSPDNSSNLNIWKNLYAVIYQCNDLLTQIEPSPISDSKKRSIKGQCFFLRALCYYFLVNLYQNVPLILHTNVNENRTINQSEPSEIYQAIISDLLEAKDHLKGEDQNIYATIWAVSALLAKTAFNLKDWKTVIDETTFVINSGRYTLESVSSVFHVDSKETVLQFWTQEGFITSATSLIPASATVVPSTLITDELYDVFDDNDLRKLQWIGTNVVTTNDEATSYHFPYKYKNRSMMDSHRECLVSIRLAEVYLLRAEAFLYLGEIAEAMADLNRIRERAGLQVLNTTDPEEVFSLLEKECRKELFAEWGIRFISLKRTGRLDEVLGKAKPTWTPDAKNLPVPQNELMYNSNLKQNPGYN